MEYVGKGLGLMLCAAHSARSGYMEDARKCRKITCSSTRHFVCRRCTYVGDGTEKSVEILCDKVETAKGFCYLGDRLNASAGCETDVTSRGKIGWMKFREYRELLLGRRFSLRMKGMVYRSYVVFEGEWNGNFEKN